MHNLKPLVIYHDNCADGFGAAFAAWLKLGDEAEYLPMQYGYDLLPDFKERKVYILDFSWQKQHMEDLFRGAKRVVWLDHHKTAFEMWCGSIPKNGVFENVLSYADAKDYILLDNNRSGAMLAWKYFHPGTEVPIFIKHIDDYDRWQFKIEGTKAFNKALWSYAPWFFNNWKNLFVGMDHHGDPEMTMSPRMYDEGAAILRAHEQNVQAVVKGAGTRCLIQEKEVRISYLGLAANCPPHLASDVGHELAIQSGTFGLLWYIDSEGKCKCSLRSNGDYDVSAIAKAFGGGGHKNAAGFEVSILTLLSWME